MSRLAYIFTLFVASCGPSTAPAQFVEGPSSTPAPVVERDCYAEDRKAITPCWM